MSVDNSLLDKTMDTAVSAPEPEPEFIAKEGHPFFQKAILWLIIDLLITLILIALEYALFKDEIEKLNLIIYGVSALAVFLITLIFILSRKTILVIIIKYAYIIIGSLYFGYKLVMKILSFIENENDIPNIDLITFVATLASIVPRIFVFYYVESLAKVCAKVDNSRRILEHEKFLEKLGKKMDKGGYSRWSNLEVERTSSAYITDKSQEENDEHIY